MKRPDPLKRLERLMARLRAPGGCPWDRRQTHKSLKPYLLEETHEVLEAIDSGNMASLREELGDVLLQVVFHAQLARERGAFDFEDVAETLNRKLIRRHPHVFGKAGKSTIRELNARWEQLKKEEKPHRKSPLDGLPKSLPALQRAQRMHEKLAKARPSKSAKALNRDLSHQWLVFRKSLKGRRAGAEKAAGEFLLAFTALAHSSGIHAEMELSKAANRFERQARETKPENSAGFDLGTGGHAREGSRATARTSGRSD
jgi:tetrapyrrole methylase family protein/MazG family protein